MAQHTHGATCCVTSEGKKGPFSVISACLSIFGFLKGGFHSDLLWESYEESLFEQFPPSHDFLWALTALNRLLGVLL